MADRLFAGRRLNFSVGFEDTFIPQAGPGMRPLDEYALTGHYEHWSHDLGLAAALGVDQVRWGIPWYRINTAPHAFRFDWLDQVVDRFCALNLEPIVDLMHYGTPTWLEGGFANPDYPSWVAEYAQAVADRYRGRLRVYTPMNEPLLNALYCGQYGYWPPYFKGEEGFAAILRSLTRGMVLTYEALSEADPSAVFVNVEASFRYVGDRDAYPDQVAFADRRRFLVEDLIMGKVGGDHPLLPWLQAHGFGDRDLDWYKAHAVRPDVIGVNYYPQVSTVRYVAGHPHSGSPLDPMPFRNDGVAGLTEVLTLFADRYGLPVYLTETGWPGPVEERIDWLKQSVQAVDDLRAGGMDLVGYTWWSLFDMIDWSYRYGKDPAVSYLSGMGLWDLADNRKGSFDRVRTAAADEYARIIRDHR